jgi:hypothetical protein
MKCATPPLRTVVKIGANPHGSKAADTSDTLKTDIDGSQSLAKKALAMLHDQQIVIQQAQTANAPADPTEGEIIAVEIDSTVLAACIWLAFREDFDPQDGKAVFYAHELEFLKNKTPEQLQKIHALKLGAKGLGTKVRQ